MNEAVAKWGSSLLVFWLVFHFAPLLITGRSYGENSQIASRFPIAIVVDGRPGIVQWFAYQNHKDAYASKLITGAGRKAFTVGEFGKVVLTSDDGVTFNVDYVDDDYRFWSQYAIHDGMVQPISYRLAGVAILFYATLAGLIWSVLFERVRTLQLSRMRRASVVSWPFS
ncbi:MAG: hypothetical protein ACJ8GW_18395 [Massilia sp.]